MVLQSPVEFGSPNKNELDYDNPVAHKGRQKKTLKGIVSFFNPVNPATWFNNIRDIKITLEEFQLQKVEDV